MNRWVVVILGFLLVAGLNTPYGSTGILPVPQAGSLCSRFSQAQEPSGQDLVKRLNCQACHTVAGQGGKLGPKLDKVGQRLAPAAIKKLLASPHSGMPNFAHLKPDELDAVVSYLFGLNRIVEDGGQGMPHTKLPSPKNHL